MARQLLFGVIAVVFFGAVILAEDLAPRSRNVQMFVNVYNHPKTGFSCSDKQAGQYYADPATKCAVYYVCISSPNGGLYAQSFACPNGTIFSQATRVCRPHEEVFCPLAERYYDNARGAIDVFDKVPLLPVAPEVPNPPPQPRPTITRSRQANHSPSRQTVQRTPQPAPQPIARQIEAVRFEPPPPPPPQTREVSQIQPRSRSQARLAPQAPAPVPVPFVPAPVQVPASAPAVRPGGRLFRSRSSQAQQPAQVPTTTTTTTTTTTPPPPPPPPSAPAGNGQPANFEYDYGDYSDYNETSPAHAASELSEQIAELFANADPEEMKGLLRRRRDVDAQNEEPEVKADDSLNRRRGQMEMEEAVEPTDAVVGGEIVVPSSFSCSDKVSGLAYADIENGCSGYFMCVTVSKGKMQPVRLACSPTEKFHQASGVCMASISKKECAQSELYFFYNKLHKASKKHLLAAATKKWNGGTF